MYRSFWSLFVVFLLSTLSLISLEGQGFTQKQSSDSDWTPQSIQQVGLTGALFLACGILWRTLQAERVVANQKSEADKVLAVETAKTMTAALVAAAASNVELRHIIEESVAAKRELAEEIKLLRQAIGTLPCTVEHHG